MAECHLKPHSYLFTFKNNGLVHNFILKLLLNLLQHCFCFLFFFGHEACGILASRPGIKPTPLALEGEVLTPGPQQGSPIYSHFKLRLRREMEIDINIE